MRSWQSISEIARAAQQEKEDAEMVRRREMILCSCGDRPQSTPTPAPCYIQWADPDFWTIREI